MTYANALNVTQQYPSANMTANDTLNDVDSIIEMYYVIHVSVMVPFENDYQFSYNHVKPAVHRALTDAGVRLCDNLTDWNSKNTFKVIIILNFSIQRLPKVMEFHSNILVKLQKWPVIFVNVNEISNFTKGEKYMTFI